MALERFGPNPEASDSCPTRFQGCSEADDRRQESAWPNDGPQPEGDACQHLSGRTRQAEHRSRVYG